MVAVQRVRAWPVESQQTARRNAMLASTSLTQRRTEREEVEDFLASFYGPSHEPQPAASPRQLAIHARPRSAVAHG